MFSPPPFGLSLESEPFLYALVGFRLNLIARAPIKEKVFAWAHHLMQNLFHNHHPSPITFHIPLPVFRFLGQPPPRNSSEAGKPGQEGGIGSYSKHSITKKSLRVGQAVEIGVPIYIDSEHRFCFHLKFLSGQKRGLLVEQGEWLLQLYNRKKEPQTKPNPTCR